MIRAVELPRALVWLLVRKRLLIKALDFIQLWLALNGLNEIAALSLVLLIKQKNEAKLARRSQSIGVHLLARSYVNRCAPPTFFA